MTDRPRRVVLLIDYDNLQICASRDTPGRDLQLTPVVQLAQRYGTVITARAYAEWNLSTERLAVYKAGIEPAFAPVLRTESDRSGKSLADTVMVAEGMDMLWTLSPEVVVLATSDKDLIPLVRVAKQRGAFVVVLGSDFTAIPLREMADEHITYRQLINEGLGRTATEAGPARQPAALPEPARRRTRERNGRERATAPPPSTAPQSAPAQPTSAAFEPVAPVTSPTLGESDGQSGGRRRRRRGSRRRADRVSATGEPVASVSDAAIDQTEITPTSHDVEQATAEGEQLQAHPGAEVQAQSPSEVEPEPIGEAAAAPAPRERRRSRRRTAVPASEVDGAPAESDVPATPPAESPVPEQSADVEPAPPPEVGPPNGPAADDAEVVAPAPTRRPRRVASATRGRSRRP